MAYSKEEQNLRDEFASRGVFPNPVVPVEDKTKEIVEDLMQMSAEFVYGTPSK